MSRIVVSVVFGLLTIPALSQDLLNERVTFSVDDASAEELFSQITTNVDCRFSYNPSILPGKQFSGDYTDSRIKDVLVDALGRGYQYKVRGSYIIIQSVAKEPTRSSVQFSGEVVDASTGERLPKTSIYEINKLTATLSDMDGTYNLLASGNPKSIAFAISKVNYQDTIVHIDPNQKNPFKIALKPLEKEKREKRQKTSPADSVKLVRFLVKDASKVHMRNVSLQETRFAQISFLPGLGTNGFLSGEVANNLSFNVLAGYSYGLNGLELGGLVNIDRMNVSGVQLGGLANIVGGATHGLQMAGFANVNLKAVNGAQMAGFVNIAKESDVQLAGFVNTSRDHELQMAGFVNVAGGETRGSQISGFLNFNSKNVSGLQLTGFLNMAKNSDVQISGFVNLTGENKVQIGGFNNFASSSDGAQIAGFTNMVWKDLNGVQISGFFNFAKTVNGAQIAAVNVANSVESGFVFGVVNFIKEGLHRIELEHNDLTDFNLNYKSGTKHFYSTVSAGIDPKNELWSYGWGLGTEIGIGESFYTDLELSVHNIQSTDRFIKGHSNDYRFNVSLGYQLNDLLGINLGPVLHYYFFDPNNPEDAPFPNRFGLDPIFSNQRGNQLNKLWIGYRVALTLL